MSDYHIKDFDQWSKCKQKLDDIDKLPTFNERDIWWCSIGLNIGFEMFGKSKIFTRPVFILRKFGKATFVGIPMTSNKKKGYYRYPYALEGKQGSMLIDQIRTYDARRLHSLIETVPEHKVEKIKQAVKTCLKL